MSLQSRKHLQSIVRDGSKITGLPVRAHFTMFEQQTLRTPAMHCAQCLSGSIQDAGSAAQAAGHRGGEHPLFQRLFSSYVHILPWPWSVSGVASVPSLVSNNVHWEAAEHRSGHDLGHVAQSDANQQLKSLAVYDCSTHRLYTITYVGGLLCSEHLYMFLGMVSRLPTVLSLLNKPTPWVHSSVSGIGRVEPDWMTWFRQGGVYPSDIQPSSL